MIHLAWMLLLFAATPDILSDALPDCILQVPVTVTVAAKNEIEHEDCHVFHATLRQTYGKPTVYVGNGKAAVVDEPSIHLSSVAADVPASQRGPVYKLYLVDAQRWWERQPTYILDESFSYLAGTGFYISKGRTSDAVYSAARARELSRYATVLLRLARRLPGYDSRQLQAIIEYQWKRVGIVTSSAGATAHNSRGPAPAADSARQRILPGPTSAPVGTTGAQRRPALADDVWVIAWTASWCGSCKTLLPLYDRIRARGVKVYELDVDSPPADWAHLRPQSVPQVRLYRGQRRVGLWSGASEAVMKEIEEAVK